jgi:hypothetical protein
MAKPSNEKRKIEAALNQKMTAAEDAEARLGAYFDHHTSAFGWPVVRMLLQQREPIQVAENSGPYAVESAKGAIAAEIRAVVTDSCALYYTDQHQPARLMLSTLERFALAVINGPGKDDQTLSKDCHLCNLAVQRDALDRAANNGVRYHATCITRIEQRCRTFFGPEPKETRNDVVADRELAEVSG